MSRLIVKNLPPYVTPARLRQHFEQPGGPTGSLTDIKVSLKQDGTSRRFGFVGFKTDLEAAKAKEYFDRTFIDSTRINVLLVEDGGAPHPRPHKRARLGPSPMDQSTSAASPRKGNSKDTDDTKVPSTSKSRELGDFMQVMQPRTKKGPSWANEDSVPLSVAPPKTVDKVDASEDVDMVERGEPISNEPLSDLEWMKQRMSTTVDEVNEAVFEQSDEEDGPSKTSPPEDAGEVAKVLDEPKDPIKETILQTSRLFVRNLTFSCADAELSELFSPYGEISKIHIPIDTATKQPKGVAYVTFVAPVNALAAYEALDKKTFQGRLLHILAAVDRKSKSEVEEGEGKKKSVKEEKNAKRKTMAGKEFNWSMLYMNSDAVASSISSRMNISKSDILNPESSEGGANPAVKLALAETHIIQETKTFFETNGVALSSFSSRARSDTVILVKNIPFGTTETQIREMFEPHGELIRVLVPPAGTIAVVEFLRPDEAAKGFKAVAYRRLGNSVVYLEKGPLGIFIEGIPPKSTHVDGLQKDLKPISSTTAKISELDNAQVEEEEMPTLSGGTTLYIKNLSFATTQEKLVSIFSHLPSFSFARIQTKPDPKRPGARLSMGYGFVGFKEVEGAKKALKSMQGFSLDGHELHVKFAGRGKEEMEKDVGGVSGVGSKSRTTKMIVKNVPFEATKKDIRDLFSSHGQLKSVRLPKKFDSRTRGFAFLEFLTRHEAENAYNALQHTHLLGRHLILEWAEEAEQDLDLLRKKAGVGFGAGLEMPGRKRKLDLGKKGDEDVEGLED